LLVESDFYIVIIQGDKMMFKQSCIVLFVLICLLLTGCNNKKKKAKIEATKEKIVKLEDKVEYLSSVRQKLQSDVSSLVRQRTTLFGEAELPKKIEDAENRLRELQDKINKLEENGDSKTYILRLKLNQTSTRINNDTNEVEIELSLAN
jgi:outer membrane murein-binding lipoprotein Lpp